VKTHHRRLKDRKHINVNDPQVLLEQSQYLGKKPHEVVQATVVVGTEMDAVAAYLKV
jgi:hypothetical protein